MRSFPKIGIAILCLAVLVCVAFRSPSTAAPQGEPKADIKPVAAGFVVEPYLQFATRDSIVVMAETAEPTTCVVEYDTLTPMAKSAKTEKPDTMHEVKLDKLEPGTKYFYRVTCTKDDGTRIASEILTFQTAVGEDDAWSFAVIGDTQRNPAITAKITKLMWDRRPHFAIHCGDVVDDGAKKDQWVGDLFAAGNKLFSRVPLYPCIGNHEKNHANYYKYFSLPKPEYYYSFQYGNAEFFSLDTNTLRTLSIQPGGEQYDWLDKALAASKATWKIVYHHHPVLSSDSDDYGNTLKGKSTGGDLRLIALGKLYEKHNVDLVFNGHIHLYERSWPVRGGKVNNETGVTHITSGGGGGKLEDFGPTPTWFKAECRVDYHYCYLSVQGGTLNFKAFDQEGRLFDQYSKRKHAK
jgi:acid phosphatase type 7